MSSRKTKSAIEEKRDKATLDLPVNEKLSDLGRSIGITIGTLLWTFIVGSRVVYACKVAQAGILPTDLECMPYKPVPIQYNTNNPTCDIDIKYVYDKNSESYTPYSTKIVFPITEETVTNNIFINKIRDIEYNPFVNPLVKYLCVVLNQVIVFHFGTVSGILNFMNQTFNESTIILIGPYLLKFYLLFAYFINIFVCFIICVTNIGWLFESNLKNDTDFEGKGINKPVWVKCDIFKNWKNIFGTLLYLTIAFWVLIGMCFSPLATIIAFMAVFTPLFNKDAKIVPPNEEDAKNIPENEWTTYGYMQSLKGVLTTKIHFIMFLFGMKTTMDVFTNLGAVAGFFVLVATLVFLYKTNSKSEGVPSLATPTLYGFDKNSKRAGEQPTNVVEDARLNVAREDYKKLEAEKEKEEANRGFLPLVKGWGDTWFNVLTGADEKCPEEPITQPAIASVPAKTIESVPAKTNATKGTSNTFTYVNPMNHTNKKGGGFIKDSDIKDDALVKRIKELTKTLKHRSV